jgi:hypothetical protein
MMTRMPDSTDRTRRHWSRQLVLLLPLLIAGCMSDRPAYTRDRDIDPLTGLPARIPAPDRRASADYPDRATTGSLAGSSGFAPEGVSGLGIRESNGGPAERGNVHANDAWSGPDSRSATGSGARLGSAGGNGLTDNNSRVAPASSAALGSASDRSPIVRMRSFEEAQQFLMARGVKWQRLQTTGEGEWAFACTIPNRIGAGSMKTYEAKDKYGLVAIQKVIDEIVRDQSGR